MSKTSVTDRVLLCCVGLILVGCRRDPALAARQSFVGATEAYFAWYYIFAIGEALDPSVKDDDARAGVVRATVRRTSRIWASALQDSLDLEDTRFQLRFTTIPDIQKGEGLADARPGPARVLSYEGTWRRSDELLVLTVLRVDDHAATDPFILEGAWRGDEIEIRGARGDSIFSSIILWRGGAP